MTTLELWVGFANAALASGAAPEDAVQNADQMLRLVEPRLRWAPSSAQDKPEQSRVPLAVDLLVEHTDLTPLGLAGAAAHRALRETEQ